MRRFSRGFVDGTLIFNFTTGDYTYYTGGAANDGASFDLSFVAVDGDGDTATAVQTINVIDGKPVERQPKQRRARLIARVAQDPMRGTFPTGPPEQLAGLSTARDL